MFERGNLSRRGFLRHTTSALVAAGLPLWYAREVAGEEDSVSARKKPGKDGELVMGAIGIGSPKSRGRGVYNNLTRCKGVRFVAACDVDKSHLDRAVSKDMAKEDEKVQGYEDYRELLERKDINAVLVATPDHWHAQIAIDAMRRGLDVYCEKPLTLTVEEALAMMEAGKQTNAVLQTGSQQRSEYGGKFRMVCELIRNGRIGKLKKIECRIGTNPKGTFEVAEVPKGLNWDFWLGPTPEVAYVPQRCHYEFRWWYDYSGGKMTDWGAHHIDIAQWALDADGSGPVSLEPISQTKPNPDPNSYNTHPNFEVKCTYANGVPVHVMSDGENGIHFEGEDGWIFVSRGKLNASKEELLKEPLAKDAERLEVATNHAQNFADCVRSRKQPICNVNVGGGSVIVCHIGTIAIRLNKALKWDPKKYEFDNADANAMLSRKRRGKWQLAKA